jgi:hypothetical protein
MRPIAKAMVKEGIKTIEFNGRFEDQKQKYCCLDFKHL